MRQNKMEEQIKKSLIESIEVKKQLIESYVEEISKMSSILTKCVKKGKKILICGNGGSAADSQHFATELIIRFEKERKSIPAIALTTDTSAITACSNDYNFSEVFKRQISSLGNKGDLLIAISTSGNSSNIIEAIKEAKNKKMEIICLLGKNGGEIANMKVKNKIIVPSNNTARIQEAHIVILHILCELLDKEIK